MNGKWINKDTENLTHSGDNLAVKFSDADAPDDNKVWSSEKINTISGALAAQIPTDFYSQAEVDGLITTASGDIVAQIPTDFYTQAEVDTISGALNDKIGAAGAVDIIDYFTVTSGNVTSKSVTLSQTPVSAAAVGLDIVGGTTQYYGTDYTVSGTTLGWNGLGLDGVIEVDDKMRAIYSY
jgi:hypothetical protein